MTTNPKSTEPLLTIEQVATQMNVSVKTIRRRIEDGALAVIRDGRILRIRQKEYPCGERYPCGESRLAPAEGVVMLCS